MTILNTSRRILVAAATVLLLGQSSWGQDNPHWDKNKCQVCHMDASPLDGQASLRDGQDTEAVCESCHGGRGPAVQCRHASDLEADADAMAEEFRGSLKGGEIVCSTCHDVVYQCKRPKPYYGLENPGFLRDRNREKSGDYCQRCHEVSPIDKLNPHAGVAGSPPSATCMLCHQTIPVTSDSGQLELAFNMSADTNDMCRGCHNVKAHPLNLFARNPSADWIHLVVPSDEILRKMRETEESRAISLPLEPRTGRVFCATCHNPHDFKVGGEHGSPVGTKHKLRTHNICQACHDK